MIPTLVIGPLETSAIPNTKDENTHNQESKRRLHPSLETKTTVTAPAHLQLSMIRCIPAIAGWFPVYKL